jgi:hypothetical protein
LYLPASLFVPCYLLKDSVLKFICCAGSGLNFTLICDRLPALELPRCGTGLVLCQPTSQPTTTCFCSPGYRGQSCTACKHEAFYFMLLHIETCHCTYVLLTLWFLWASPGKILIPSVFVWSYHYFYCINKIIVDFI